MIDGSRVAVICGPTAVGKGTVVSRLAARVPEVWVSVSATTRPPRPGEVDGVDYHFVDDAHFDALLAGDGLLEYAVVHRNARYGTPREAVVEALEAGRFVILEIDIQGARQVRTTWPEAQFIFLEPPSWEELERRLVGRGTENAEQRARRLESARVEMEAADEFDHVLINAEVEPCVDQLIALLSL